MSSGTPVKINVNQTACLCCIMYELHHCRLIAWIDCLIGVNSPFPVPPSFFFFFAHSCPLSHLPSGICSHLWRRQPSGVYSRIHQRSDPKVFLHRKVHRHTSVFMYVVTLQALWGYYISFCTVDFIYTMSNLLVCMCLLHSLCAHCSSSITPIIRNAFSWVCLYLRL